MIKQGNLAESKGKTVKENIPWKQTEGHCMILRVRERERCLSSSSYPSRPISWTLGLQYILLILTHLSGSLLLAIKALLSPLHILDLSSIPT